MAVAGVTARHVLARLAAAGETAAASGRARLTTVLGGAAQARVVLVLAGLLGLSSADVATVGASATELRHSLAVSNTDLGPEKTSLCDIRRVVPGSAACSQRVRRLEHVS